MVVGVGVIVAYLLLISTFCWYFVMGKDGAPWNWRALLVLPFPYMDWLARQDWDF